MSRISRSSGSRLEGNFDRDGNMWEYRRKYIFSWKAPSVSGGSLGV